MMEGGGKMSRTLRWSESKLSGALFFRLIFVSLISNVTSNRSKLKTFSTFFKNPSHFLRFHEEERMRKYLQGQRQQGLDKVLLSVLPWILYLVTLTGWRSQVVWSRKGYFFTRKLTWNIEKSS